MDVSKMLLIGLAVTVYFLSGGYKRKILKSPKLNYSSLRLGRRDRELVS